MWTCACESACFVWAKNWFPILKTLSADDELNLKVSIINADIFILYFSTTCDYMRIHEYIPVGSLAGTHPDLFFLSHWLFKFLTTDPVAYITFLFVGHCVTMCSTWDEIGWNGEKMASELLR